MHESCMPIKTISLELDAYEKLKRQKRGRESFSQVVRRAEFNPDVHANVVCEPQASYGAPKAESLLDQASRLTGVSDESALVQMGLEALVSRYSARRLAALGGSESEVKIPPRRR